MSEQYLLSVQDLHTTFRTDSGEVQAVNGVSFNLNPGEILGIVGESGSGKSVTAYSVMQILADNGRIKSGHILYKGEDLTTWSEKQMSHFRGKCCSIVFQDPMTSLNPVYTIGNQIVEVILLHTKKTKQEAWARAKELLELVGINEPDRRLKQYPHELSGGMRQRVMIAIALACEPKLLIADEPTTALDVTIQAQVLAMMMELKKKLNTAMIMITHDLGIVAQTCDLVAVMYAGEIIEYGTVEQVFTGDKHHPYTVGLFNSIPNLELDERRLHPIDGMMPDPTNLPEGCAFSPRCPHATEHCRQSHPEQYDVNGLRVRCFLYNGEEGQA